MRWESEPVCLMHGTPHSEHPNGRCLYCCLCFKQLEIEDCNVLADGRREDVCVPCAKEELDHEKTNTTDR